MRYAQLAIVAIISIAEVAHSQSLKTTAEVIAATEIPTEYTSPGETNTKCRSTADDNGDVQTRCTSETTRPSTYTKMGADVKLRLADGRYVSLSCEPKEWVWNSGCRWPLAHFRVLFELHGDKAKLSWREYTDGTGKKTISLSQTYRVILMGSLPEGTVPPNK